MTAGKAVHLCGVTATQRPAQLAAEGSGQGGNRQRRVLMGSHPIAESGRRWQRSLVREPGQKFTLGAPPRATDDGHGPWFDTEYAACVFSSARAKAQRLEIAAWGPLQCHHVHAEHQWTPTRVDGVTIS